MAGLLALIRLHRAAPPPASIATVPVLLQDQDRSLWDNDAIDQAGQVLARAANQQRPGPYQLQAAIVACHADAGCWDDTDCEQIVLPATTYVASRAVARHAPAPRHRAALPVRTTGGDG